MISRRAVLATATLAPALSLGLAGVLLAAAPSPARAQVMAITAEGRAAILARPDTPFAGWAPAGADVTVVEYLDFNCPYCRKLAVSLGALIAGDQKLRVLYKDWPIFGGVSVYAARAALAARWQGRYLDAHTALIGGTGRLTSEAVVRERLRGAGIDLTRMETDLTAHTTEIDAILARNADEAAALGFQGTPGLVVGDFIAPGALETGDLRKLAEASRLRPAAR